MQQCMKIKRPKHFFIVFHYVTSILTPAQAFGRFGTLRAGPRSASWTAAVQMALSFPIRIAGDSCGDAVAATLTCRVERQTLSAGRRRALRPQSSFSTRMARV
jgi:hypothetical protein